MRHCQLKIKDQVNVRFEGLDPATRRALCDALKYDVPYARHTPQYKMGRWDGKKHFATTGGATFLNLLDKALPVVYDAGYDIELVDERLSLDIELPSITDSILSDKSWPVGHPLAGEPIILRDYQVEAINTYFKNWQSVQQISTGAGKTMITATISYVVEKYGRTITIVPSKALVEQTEEDFKNIGLDVGVLFGDRKEFGRQHTIATWQSLSSIAKATRQGEAEVTIFEVLDGVVCVQIDECHTSKADVLKDLLTGPFSKVVLRWGMTGTLPPEDFNFASVLVSIGPIVGEIKAKDLQEKGVLSKCHVHIEQLDDSHVEYKSYEDEHKYLVEDKFRLIWLAKRIAEVAESGNTLVLVNNISTGKMLQSFLPGSVFISGAVKTKDRSAEFKQAQGSDDKIYIATYGVAAVGINVPRIFNLFLFEAGASFTRVIQSIGRSLRVAKDKWFANIYDVCSNLKFSARHLAKRKKFYKEAEYPFSLTKINYDRH